MSKDHDAWIAQVDEAPLDAGLPICDPHHHLWLDTRHTGSPYPLDAFHADTGSGHNIVQTVFLECGAEYRTEGPTHLQPVGEVEWIAEIAEQTTVEGTPTIAAIIGHADVTLGDAVEEVLLALEQAGRGRFRGVRYITAHDDHPPLGMGVPSGIMQDPGYIEGVRKVHAMGYSYETMVYHPQIPQLIEVARACPDQMIIADHLCAPIGVGPYKGKRDEVLQWWRPQMEALAQMENVLLKVGGIGMPMFGPRWDRQDRPPTSEELAGPWTRDLQHCIDVFGPDRCMFESNFPVDKRGVGYVVLWNAFKRIAAGYSDDEKRDLFHDTAARAYRIDTIAH